MSKHDESSLPPSFEVYPKNRTAGTHALHELYSLVQFYGGPNLLKEVQAWADRNLNVASVEVGLHHPTDEKHREHVLKSSFCQLGKHLAERANMYHDWEKTDYGFRFVAKCLYFRNEFGK